MRAHPLIRHAVRAARLVRGKMIGFFHPGNDDPGVWNPDFRPLRSPLPLIVIRHLVMSDAPFVAKRPRLWAPYLFKFPVGGLQRLTRS